MKAVVLQSDLKVHAIEYQTDAECNPRVLNEVVGGFLEPIFFNWLNYEFIAWCNEEGKLEKLPFNSLATLAIEVARDLVWGDMIAGNVVITSASEDPHGCVEGLNEDAVGALQHLLNKCLDYASIDADSVEIV